MRNRKASICGTERVQEREAAEEDREEYYDGKLLDRNLGEKSFQESRYPKVSVSRY